MITTSPPALCLERVSKTFPGQQALSGVGIEIQPGEVHALLGQNGSGKSTLIKILAGYHRPDRGAHATLAGQPFELGSAHAARIGGIRFLHQDLGLIPELNAVDNLALGGRYRGRYWLSDRKERRAASEALQAHGIDLDPGAPLSSLSAAQSTMLAIVRAMQDGEPGLLVLDEPTATLPEHEVRQLFALINGLRRLGRSVLYVTHRLSEIFDVADVVTILRDGKNVTTQEVRSLTHQGLVELIVGRPLEQALPTGRQEMRDPDDTPLLSLSCLSGPGVVNVSADIRRGEVVGVTGLVGSGYDDLLRLAFGARRAERGVVFRDGSPVPAGDPRASIRRGMAFAPADRKRLSAMTDWSLRENITLPRIPQSRLVRWLGIGAERDEVRPWLQRLGVVPHDTERRFSALSGGNQQKVVLARWFRCSADVMLLEEPTNGVDMGAKQSIYAALRQAAAEGKAVLLSSSDAEELCEICDRVFVMRAGHIGAELAGSHLTVERLVTESLRADSVSDAKLEMSS